VSAARIGAGLLLGTVVLAVSLIVAANFGIDVTL